MSRHSLDIKPEPEEVLYVEYAKAEGCSQRIYVYIKNEDHPQRDTKIEQKYKDELRKGNNPPELFIIDVREKKSASIR